MQLTVHCLATPTRDRLTAVVDAGGEVDLGRLEGIVGREVDVEIEDTATVWAVIGAQDRGTPMEEVTVVLWACRAVCGGIPTCKKEVDSSQEQPYVPLKHGGMCVILISLFFRTTWTRSRVCKENLLMSASSLLILFSAMICAWMITTTRKHTMNVLSTNALRMCSVGINRNAGDAPPFEQNVKEGGISRRTRKPSLAPAHAEGPSLVETLVLAFSKPHMPDHSETQASMVTCR